MATSPPSTVYGGQHDTKYVTFELLTHAAFVADEIWGFIPEPARIVFIVYKGVFGRVRTKVYRGYLPYRSGRYVLNTLPNTSVRTLYRYPTLWYVQYLNTGTRRLSKFGTPTKNTPGADMHGAYP